MMDKDAQSVTQELKACPFCDQRLEHHNDLTVHEGFYMHPGVVTDRDCVLSGKGFYEYELPAWNTRASQPTSAEDAVAWTDERMIYLRESAEEMLDHQVNYIDPVFMFGQACVNYGFSLASRPTPDTQTAAIGAEAMREAWTDATPPNSESAYDHCQMETPLGLARVEWKSWKDCPGYTVEVGYEWVGSFDSLDEAKDAAIGHLASVRDALAAFLSQPVAAPQAEMAGGEDDLPYQSDDWKLKGYPSAAAEIEDMANVGRSFMECVAEVVKSSGPFKGWHPADCPTELVSDMANMIDELSTPPQPEGGTASDSDDYEHTFYGILNKQGQFWTPLPFDNEEAARDHLSKFAVGQNKPMLDTHKIVPVRVRLTALQPEKTK